MSLRPLSRMLLGSRLSDPISTTLTDLSSAFFFGRGDWPFAVGSSGGRLSARLMLWLTLRSMDRAYSPPASAATTTTARNVINSRSGQRRFFGRRGGRPPEPAAAPDAVPSENSPSPSSSVGVLICRQPSSMFVNRSVGGHDRTVIRHASLTCRDDVTVPIVGKRDPQPGLESTQPG